MVKVTVTKQDIADGRRRNSLHCPVAIALSRATNQDWWVGDATRSSGREGVVLNPAIGEEFDAPRSVSRFMRRFDRGDKNVKPFEFEVPDDCVFDDQT